ncbi:hypothetical protein K2173_014679 [Erythroxylum novogranatense]|uniref:Pentatricopeptide repeat-containing protein n=1 Tax=Erythroxylum novogranatense TaxID=1862640 RepID=A0AAV8TFI1_9ROSI|nr:hypothetical protein K2173_014679 [Erythroxylum novogranatense]
MINLKTTNYLFKGLFPRLSAKSCHSTCDYLNGHLNSIFCLRHPSFDVVLKSHALVITSGNTNNVFISSKLISFYASSQRLHSCNKVFYSVNEKDTFLWNSLIQSHFSCGNYAEAYDFYVRMRLSNILPSQFTFPMVVATCAELLWVNQGKCVHGLVAKSGLFEGNCAVGSSLVYMYSKFGFTWDAGVLFDEMTVRDVVSWTTLVIGYAQNGESELGLECISEMHRTGGIGERMNFRTMEGGLQACADLGALVVGRCLHAFVVKTGLGCSLVVQSSLLSIYSKCGDLSEGCNSFSELVDKDLISWTSIINIHARYGLMYDCISLFWDMQIDGLFPDRIILSCILSGFGNSLHVREGKAFHGLIIRKNYVIDHIVNTALLSMYCKFGLLIPSEKLFDKEHEWSKESCAIMVCGYAKLGMGGRCIELFREMQNEGIKTDSSCLVSVISSCSQLGAIRLCRSIHGYVIRALTYQNVSIANALIDMYGKSGNLTVAKRIFYRTNKDVVTWNTLISSYVCCGVAGQAIALFEHMILQKFKPNQATLVTVLSACSNVASLDKGEMVHRYIEKEGFELNVSLVSALVNMYAKCGQLEKSRQLFNSMEERDAISWNVMISGYGMHGHAKSAIEIFQQMERSKVKPNAITFLLLISACAHAGLVEEGKNLFNRMHLYSVEPSLKIYTCLVDLLGRSGKLLEAEEVVLSMPFPPDGNVWGALLSACKIHNQIETGLRIARRAIESDPDNDGYHIMLANMLSYSGKWEQAQRVREMMKARGVEKAAGWSAV